MKETILKQHRYKTGSIKKLVEYRKEDTNKVIGYAAIFKTSDNVILDKQESKNLPDCKWFYKAMHLNHCKEKFLTKKGQLTLYALTCGYIEEYTFTDDSYKELWLDCDTIYVHHFKYYGMPRATSQSFEKKDIVQARKFYDSIVVK